MPGLSLKGVFLYPRRVFEADLVLDSRPTEVVAEPLLIAALHPIVDAGAPGHATVSAAFLLHRPYNTALAPIGAMAAEAGEEAAAWIWAPRGMLCDALHTLVGAAPWFSEADYTVLARVARCVESSVSAKDLAACLDGQEAGLNASSYTPPWTSGFPAAAAGHSALLLVSRHTSDWKAVAAALYGSHGLSCLAETYGRPDWLPVVLYWHPGTAALDAEAGYVAYMLLSPGTGYRLAPCMQSRLAEPVCGGEGCVEAGVRGLDELYRRLLLETRVWEQDGYPGDTPVAVLVEP